MFNYRKPTSILFLQQNFKKFLKKSTRSGKRTLQRERGKNGGDWEGGQHDDSSSMEK